MLQTVKDACKFDQKAIDYALSGQIENLDDLAGHQPKDAKERRKKQKSYGAGSKSGSMPVANKLTSERS